MELDGHTILHDILRVFIRQNVHLTRPNSMQFKTALCAWYGVIPTIKILQIIFTRKCNNKYGQE